jgi:hypothetical protein
VEVVVIEIEVEVVEEKELDVEESNCVDELVVEAL